MKKIHPTISDEQHKKIKELVDSGSHTSISEVVRDALRMYFRKD